MSASVYFGHIFCPNIGQRSVQRTECARPWAYTAPVTLDRRLEGRAVSMRHAVRATSESRDAPRPCSRVVITITQKTYCVVYSDVHVQKATLLLHLKVWNHVEVYFVRIGSDGRERQEFGIIIRMACRCAL